MPIAITIMFGLVVALFLINMIGAAVAVVRAGDTGGISGEAGPVSVGTFD